MSKGIVRIYYGEGHGKSTAALGTAIREASHGKSATVISFLKIIDNPYNDIALIATLRSAFYKFSDDLLMKISIIYMGYYSDFLQLIYYQSNCYTNVLVVSFLC